MHREHIFDTLVDYVKVGKCGSGIGFRRATSAALDDDARLRIKSPRGGILEHPNQSSLLVQMARGESWLQCGRCAVHDDMVQSLLDEWLKSGVYVLCSAAWNQPS